ncbi:MAG: N-acetyl-gamma-glutamyl-phosphate reductase [Actinobacteria bacterium]|nr:N-acetyl-gamma-glutamyl-phosphate reductase [Actinomycetota bacterium]
MIRTAVVGAAGTTGAELVGLLAVHPGVRLEALAGSSTAGRRWEDLHPARSHLHRGIIEAYDPAALSGLDAVFLALPHGASAAAAAALVGTVGAVIDLSGDLRLPDVGTYEAWYGRPHPAPGLVGRAAYGLPELFGGGLAGADLIANPGCYPTAVQLAAAPALTVDGAASTVAATAVSGTSGAGRSSDPALSFSEMFGDTRAYRVGRHQHAPEMAMGLSRAAGRPVGVTFVPHLVPIERGIHATVIVEAHRPVDPGALLDTYRSFYAGAPFVRVLDPSDRLPSVRAVAGTNFCEVAPSVDRGTGAIVVVAAIDNLVKGAAGQAVQVMNRRFGLPDEAGLLPRREAP